MRSVAPLLLALLLGLTLFPQSPALGQEEGNDNTDPWVRAPAPHRWTLASR